MEALPLAPGAARARIRSPRLLRVVADERLVAMVRQGSEAAFEAIYDRHHRGILSFCRHMLGSREEAEDAVQHAFLAAYRDLLRSEKPIQLRAWLYAIARNRCLSVLRARRERPAAEELEVATEGLADEVQRREDLRHLLADLMELPEDQRAAIVLAEIGSLPHEEIAEVVGCRREKVKALVFQARTSLAESRTARETPCAEIREQLATLRGGALRRAGLQRHLRSCPGCREFRAEVQRQRAAMAVILPVLPTLGLKSAILGTAFAAGAKGAAVGAAAAGHTAAAGATAGTGTTAAAAGAGAAGGSIGGGLLAAGAKGLAVKAIAVVAIAGGGTAGGVAAVDALREPAPSPRIAPASQSPAPPKPERSRGITPSRAAGPGGNSEPAREHARGRGKGRKRGLNGTRPGHPRKDDGSPARVGAQPGAGTPGEGAKPHGQGKAGTRRPARRAAPKARRRAAARSRRPARRAKPPVARKQPAPGRVPPRERAPRKPAPDATPGAAPETQSPAP